MTTINPAQPIKIAIMAMGGEGGGVLADWIVALGERNGYLAQTTSVPGVAQRTGATIYYVELFPAALAEAAGKRPVFALMPLPGDVDIVLASELMEAGRAVQRGLVTRDRTTLIASTHRVYSIAEKSAMGDGRVDSEQLLAHVDQAAKRCLRFDMEKAAQRSGTVISSVLFGALAGAEVLPFSRAQFEATIEKGGVGVKSSLAAFADAFEKVQRGHDGSDVPPAGLADVAVPTSHPEPAIAYLLGKVQTFATPAQAVLVEGLRRLIDYQDIDYAALYLQRMGRLRDLQPTPSTAVLTTTARHLALWMSYEDTARVAELKTRGTRFERVRDEAGVLADQVLDINEYMHPRLQEICESLPAGLGRWLMNTAAPRHIVEALTKKGRIIRTSSLRGFLLLRLVAASKRWRRSTLRFEQENRLIDEWLQHIIDVATINPDLAVELAECQRLVKGYSDTHERGLRNYQTVIAAARQAGSSLSAASLRELRDAALADEDGKQLSATLSRHILA